MRNEPARRKHHVVGVEPRYDFPVNEGRLCPKGVTAYLQVHHPDRLLHPLIKRNGRFERASWDEALDLVVSKFKELQAKHGKDSIGVYSGSSLTTEKTYLMGKFARAGIWHSIRRLQRPALHGLGCGRKQQGLWHRSRRESMGRYSAC